MVKEFRGDPLQPQSDRAEQSLCGEEEGGFDEQFSAVEQRGLPSARVYFTLGAAVRNCAYRSTKATGAGWFQSAGSRTWRVWLPRFESPGRNSPQIGNAPICARLAAVCVGL